MKKDFVKKVLGIVLIVAMSKGTYTISAISAVIILVLNIKEVIKTLALKNRVSTVHIINLLKVIMRFAMKENSEYRVILALVSFILKVTKVVLKICEKKHARKRL